jgi:geranylgeranyl reductase family protein
VTADLRCDVLVVGAGPAGGMAALTLARQGIGVLVVDRCSFPREKICGDGLLEESLKILTESGIGTAIRQRAHPVGNIRFYAPNGNVCQLEGDFCTLRRAELDALILEEACDCGARFLGGVQITGPLLQGDTCVGAVGVDQQRREVRIAAKVALLATGANPRMLKAFGVLQARMPDAVGIRAYFLVRDGADQNTMIVSYDRHLLPGYGWMFPVGGGIFNVGRGVFLAHLRGMPQIGRQLKTFHQDIPQISTLLRVAEQVSPLRAAPMRTGFRGALACSSGVMVLGEALGLTFPMLGEGISNALQSGRVAARVVGDALSTGNVSARFLSSYERELRQLMDDRHRGYLAAQRWFRYRPLANLLIAKAAGSRKLREMVKQILRGEMDARAVFSWYGILRILLSPITDA